MQDPALARVLVLVDVHLASESQFFCGLAGNVFDAEGGLFLSTYRSFEVGTSVDLEISLPEVGATVRARGQVRWVREHSMHEPRGIGIALDDLTLDDRRCIREFCEQRPALYYDDLG
ncbi:MAG: PilZ domain-containing protein [Labilithrix sp.]|nr:PilZ domain-containing protein [Labilithrix sp.]